MTFPYKPKPETPELVEISHTFAVNDVVTPKWARSTKGQVVEVKRGGWYRVRWEHSDRVYSYRAADLRRFGEPLLKMSEGWNGNL